MYALCRYLEKAKTVASFKLDLTYFFRAGKELK